MKAVITTLLVLSLLSFSVLAKTDQGSNLSLQTVLGAIALAESGMTYQGRFVAWPWTLNVRGKGLRFRDRETTWKALKILLANGITNVDIGAMQVNWHWNNKKLRTPWAALDPAFNLSVARKILMDRWQERGDLWQAVGAYHAPNNPVRAEKYRQRVARHYRRLLGTTPGALK